MTSLKFKAFLPTLTLTLSLSTSWGQGRLCLWFLVSTRLVLHHLIPYLHNPESFLQSLYTFILSQCFIHQKIWPRPPLRGPGGRASPQALIKSAYLLYGQSELHPVSTARSSSVNKTDIFLLFWTSSQNVLWQCISRGEPKSTSPEVARNLLEMQIPRPSRLPKETEFPGMEPWNLYSFKFP